MWRAAEFCFFTIDMSSRDKLLSDGTEDANRSTVLTFDSLKMVITREVASFAAFNAVKHPEDCRCGKCGKAACMRSDEDHHSENGCPSCAHG